jgi:hypothetical protein
MPWQYVLVRAYVPQYGGRPPGQPGQPPYVDIGFPGNQPYPDQGLPGNQPYPDQGLPGNQPYPDQGLPGNQPYPDIGFPGNQPYPDQGLPGQQPGLWPIRPPYVDIGFPGPQPGGPVYPSHPIYYPGRPTHPIYRPPYVDIGFPGNQPYPDQGLPGNQPGLWPIRPPYVDIGFPGPQPGGPVYPDQGLPGPQPYPDNSLPPVIDMGQMPDHPELPDLNAGQWMYVNRMYGTIQAAFVPWPLAVTHPDYNPRYPQQGTPGEWVAIVYGGRTVWAWIPTQDGGGNQGQGGNEQSQRSAAE